MPIPTERAVRRVEEDLGELLEQQDLSAKGRSLCPSRTILWDLSATFSVASPGQCRNGLPRRCATTGRSRFAAATPRGKSGSRLVWLCGGCMPVVDSLSSQDRLRRRSKRFSCAGRSATLSGERTCPASYMFRPFAPAVRGRQGYSPKTATGVSSLTGFHETRVLFCVTEAQDSEINHPGMRPSPVPPLRGPNSHPREPYVTLRPLLPSSHGLIRLASVPNSRVRHPQRAGSSDGCTGPTHHGWR